MKLSQKETDQIGTFVAHLLHDSIKLTTFLTAHHNFNK